MIPLDVKGSAIMVDLWIKNVLSIEVHTAVRDWYLIFVRDMLINLIELLSKQHGFL